MALEAQDNPFPYVTLVDTADPSTPAAGTKRLWVDTDDALKIIDEADVVTTIGGDASAHIADTSDAHDASAISFTPNGSIAATDVQAAIQEVRDEAAGGSVATDAIWDAAGDLVQGTGANTAARLALGTAGQVLTVNSGATAVEWGAAGGFIEQPTYTYAAQFQASSTSCAVTTAAFTTGHILLAFVYSTGRGCNSITQTNVTWTQRYTGNGNSEFFEVWTGVVSGTAGTTATFAFTGSNTQYCEVIRVTNASASAFTSASAVTTNTSASVAILGMTSAQGMTVGTFYVFGCTAAAPTSSYIMGSVPWQPLSATGGQGAGGIFRANQKGFASTQITSSSVARFMALVGIS